MPDSEFRQVLQRYARLRKFVYQYAEETAPAWAGIDVPIRFADIDSAALEAWRTTWHNVQPLGYGGWYWPAIVLPTWRRPAGLPLAIWSGEQLCGLMVGRPSKRRTDGRRHTLSLHRLEGNPDRMHPLRGSIAELALGVAELYGQALGVARVCLIDPLPGVYRIYRRLGYHIVRTHGSPVYFEKRGIS